MGRWSRERHLQEAAKKAEKLAKTTTEQPVEPTPQKEEEVSPIVSTPEKNPRNDILEDIVARRGTQPEEPKEEPKAEVKTEEPKVEVKDDPKTEVVAEVPPAEPKLVKVKVDGEEFEVPQEDIDAAGGVRAFQKEKASENRLKEAREAMNEAKRIRDEVAALADQKPKQPSQTDEQFIASKIEAVRFGTDGEAAAAIKEILSRSNPQINQDHVVNLALIQVRRQSALDKFGEEFSDVISNPVLGKLAMTLEREEMAKLPKNAIQDPAFVGKFDWNKFYRSIGNQIRGAVGRPSQTTTPTKPATDQPSPSSAKEERKASIVNLPAASAKAELPKEEKEQSREDVLNEMRQWRGMLQR